jgi:hypothetical protein
MSNTVWMRIRKQKVARKGSSDSRLNFHDFSEETCNSNTELVEEDVIASNLKDDPEYDEKHDPLSIKSAKKEENTKEDLNGVAAADLKKHECFVCDKKFSFQHSRQKHIRKFHQNACHICGSTFQTIQETAKHISGNFKKLHDYLTFQIQNLQTLFRTKNWQKLRFIFQNRRKVKFFND